MFQLADSAFTQLACTAGRNHKRIFTATLFIISSMDGYNMVKHLFFFYLKVSTVYEKTAYFLTLQCSAIMIGVFSHKQIDFIVHYRQS